MIEKKNDKPANKLQKFLREQAPKIKEFLFKQRSFVGIIKRLRASIKKYYLVVKEHLLTFLFEHYYGVKLLRPRTVYLSYTLLLVALYGILLNVVPQKLIVATGYINFTEQALTILIVLLTILLSAGLVLLGDDTRGWSLARIAIIRDVVKLKGLMLACLLIILISIAPDYIYSGLTLKMWLSPILIAAFIFILGIYFRIYLWLSDLAADPSFFDPQDPNKSDDKRDDRSYIGGSYRFARIVHLIHRLDARDAWQAVLEKKIPYGYEELLHEEFFDGAEAIINSKRKEKYGDLSVRLEIYDKYYPRRNLDSWRFYLDYTKRFLLIYSSVNKIVDANHTDQNVKYLWRGKHALENIGRQLIMDSMDSERIWSLLDAMDAYISDSSLLLLNRRTRFKSSVVLNYFLNSFFDALFDEKIDTYNFDSYFQEHTHWQVTTKNLYEERYNISFVVENAFREWLFKKLANVQDEDSLINVDSAIELIFAESDPITIGQLYWFLYNAQHTTNSNEIVEQQYRSIRRFGLIGRTLVSDWEDDESLRNQNYANHHNAEVDSAVRFFIARYGRYFRGFWNLDELIQTAENILSSELEEYERLRLESFLDRLQRMKQVLEEDSSS